MTPKAFSLRIHSKSMLQGKSFFVKMLPTLCDYSLSFTVAVHLMTGKAVMSAKQVVIKSDTEEGDCTSADVYDLEAKIRDEAPQGIRADADAKVEQDEIGTGSNAHLMHGGTVNGERMAGCRYRSVAKAKE